ncbi:ceramidase domain-containing protein [Cyanobium sp. NIES-981]|uniref:ceramidase domain-containing protein n=1 Tax=Cyanobium sp. NIES-981 TaxID=1851505 RepID=UPI0007DD662C|nr:ceramidase domain-containing protein [Cyanobium sp. NIES-981]SBO43809.1 conserved membrane protein of unknown function [Cyanobium sp. NIES-981]
MDLDLYCERLGPGLLAEPVNALTNAGFFLAAWWIWRRAPLRRGRVDRGMAVLVALVVAIGVGSTLFHTTASRWALVADVLPILLFQLVFLWLYLRRRWRLAIPPALGLVALFAAATLVSRSWPQLVNGSLAYAPSLLVLLLLGWRERGLRPGGSRSWPSLLVAGAVFAVSLTLRSVDPLVCPWLPLGTHPAWHLLNAVVLALACRSLMGPSPGPPEQGILSP